MTDEALKNGTQLGHYQITKLLGRGGFGITYQAWDTQLQRLVAIKEFFLHGQVTRALDGLSVAGKVKDPEYRRRLERFLDEARTVAQFRDPRIVHVHGFHEANNTAYMIMDFVEGLSLRDHVKHFGTVTVNEARGYLIDLLKGLQVIHARSYLHRDIKPANVIRRPDGSLLLLDFGSARQSVADQDNHFTVMVTPGYAPLEQYTSTEAQGPATDLYAAGACTLYCLTGSAPTEALQRTAADQVHIGDAVEQSLKLIASRDAAGTFLAQILTWMLRPQAVQRPQSADAVLQRLESNPGRHSSDEDVTIMTGKQAPSVDLSQLRSLPSKLVEEIRKQLEGTVGERATQLLFSSIKSSRNAQQMLDNLAVQGGAEVRSSPAFEHITSLLSTAAARKVTEQGQSPTPTRSPTVSRAVAPIIDEDSTQHISRELSKFVGPIAQMLVKRMQTKCSSLKDMLAQLEEEIPDEADRTIFRKEMQKLNLK